MTPTEWYKQTENEYINKRYIMFGLDGGEYVTEVLNNCKTEFKVIVYEPAASGVGQRDDDYDGLKGLSSAGIEIYVEGKEVEEFSSFMYHFLDYSNLPSVVTFIHPLYESLVDQIENDNNTLNLRAVVSNPDSIAYGKSYSLVYGSGNTSHSSVILNYDKEWGPVSKQVMLSDFEKVSYSEGGLCVQY